MRGLSLLIYTILFTFIFFVDQSGFLSLAGAMQGVPIQVEHIVTTIAQDISFSEIMSVPDGMELFISDCFFPNDEHLQLEDRKYVTTSCENALGVVCVFYDYFGYRYRGCQGILFTPDKVIYDKDEGSRVYSILRDLDQRTVTLTKESTPNN